MEANCNETEAKFKAADAVMWDMIGKHYSSIGLPLRGDSISGTWQRNLPSAVSEEIDNFAKVYGKIPLVEALSLLSFIEDPEAVAKELLGNTEEPTPTE